MIVHYLHFGMVPCGKPGPPGQWTDDDKWSGDWNDVSCPGCLKGKEPINLYTIAPDNLSITCKICNKTSFNPNDIKNTFCGWCGEFLDDIWPPARAWCIEHPEYFRRKTKNGMDQNQTKERIKGK